MVTCQSSELDWEVTVELPVDFLSLGRGSVTLCLPRGFAFSPKSFFSFEVSSNLVGGLFDFVYLEWD